MRERARARVNAVYGVIFFIVRVRAEIVGCVVYLVPEIFKKPRNLSALFFLALFGLFDLRAFLTKFLPKRSVSGG